MENVVAFNNELSSLYESKPPISKAKMASITKSAMRAIKFYKHVVQSVEKFILKCKPEYKVPGLYVIDSIVRQSRHQFGPEKDVFAPRFARNIKDTFANLFRCAPEDKGRIIRVLNLWQKNNVFAPEVIQPIFDLADPNQAIYQMSAGVSSSAGPSGSGGLGDLSGVSANGLNTSVGPLDMNLSGMSAGSVGHGMVEDKLGNLPDLSTLSHEKAQNVLDNSSIRHLEHKQQYLKRQITGAGSSTTTTITTKSMCETLRGSSSHLPTSTTRIHHPETYSKYTKGVHELLYHDREQKADDDNDTIGTDANSPKHTSKKILDNNNLKQLLNDPNVLRQLQTLQNFQKFKQQEEKQHKLNEMRLQEEAFEKHLQCVLKNSGPGNPVQDNIDFGKEVEFISEEQKIEVINLDGNDSRSPTPDRDRYKRRRSSRSRSRSRNRRRSRSRNRSRSPRSNRRRSRDRGNERSARDKDREREHERERRKKGLPDLRKEHLSVCSTTLWVGHLSKLVYQEELSDTFGEYGDIVSIDQIVPRGCAFIVMNRRQDAFKAMQALKNHKLQGRAITISWAAGKGVKSKEWKDFWDLELGVTYIPWNKFDENTDFDSLEEGGMFDEDSMPNWMKDKIHHIKSLKEKVNEPMPPSMPTTNLPPPAGGGGPGNLLFGIDTTQPPPAPPPSMMSMVPGQFSMAPPMGGPPRMLGPPMGMPLSAPGMPMPPNMVPGMPPPHPMMAPMGMMPPGFPPIPGAVGGPPHMGIAPAGTQFPPPPVATVSNSLSSNAPSMHTSSNVVSSDDQMDIEMEDADEQAIPVAPPSASGPQSQLNFNQPPPIFGNSISVPGTEQNVNSGNSGSSSELFVRDRNRGSSNSSRWSGRTSAGDDDVPGEGNNVPVLSRWREGNNNIPNSLSGPNGMQPNFNDNRGQGRGPGPMNIPPLDINNPPQRPEFMGDFDNRMHRGGRGGSNHNGDFFPNMQNRFNQPTSLMQMRIPPPNAFNPRMGGPGGGPPMFMRGGQGGPANRQGPGFFNPRNPFDRDVGPMLNMRGGRGGGRGRGGRGGGPMGPSGPPGSGNWSDEEIEDNFKRRGGSSGGSGNRFRDRSMDGNDDRHGRSGNDRNVGSRRGGRGLSRERSSDRDRERERSTDNRRRSSRDDRNRTSHEKKPEVEDTEEDWDAELKEYDTHNETATVRKAVTPTVKENAESDQSTKFSENEQPEQIPDKNSHENKTNDIELSSSVTETSPTYAASNALYDELPAPIAESIAPEKECVTEPIFSENEAPQTSISEAPQIEKTEQSTERSEEAADVAPENNTVEAPPMNGEEKENN